MGPKERDSNVARVLRRNLSQALQGGDLDAASGLLERLREEAPLALATRGLELEFLLRCGRLEEAADLAAQLLELFPDSPRIRFLAGRVAYKRRDYAAAEAAFRESRRLHPHPRTDHWLARTLTQAGNLDEAEALLAPLAASRPHCRRDLAWLYERRGDHERALAEVTAYLERYPDDDLARAQEKRLRARTLAPEELEEEVEALAELGAGPPEEVVPEYIEGLLASGQGRRARAFLLEHRNALGHGAVLRTGWVCHRLRAYDLAFELFLEALPWQRGNFKFLTALEGAAERCDRLDALIEVYAAQAPEEKRLYGRIKRLEKRSSSQGGDG